MVALVSPFHQGDTCRKTTGRIAPGLLAGLGAAASAPLLAHGYGPMMGHGPGGFGPMARCKTGDPEAHLTTLKTELKLTAKQEPAWQAREKTLRAQVASHGPGPRARTPAQTRRRLASHSWSSGSPA